MNKIQELVYRIIENTSFNSFDGSKVAAKLREVVDSKKGEGAIFQADFGHFITLRDIHMGLCNCDTIWLLLRKDNPFHSALRERWLEQKGDEDILLNANVVNFYYSPEGNDMPALLGDGKFMLGWCDPDFVVIQMWWT